MRSRCLFLLIYLLGNSFGGSSAQRNTSCTTNEACGQMADPTHSFLQCVGLPSTDTGTDHLRRLKEILEATMDIYTFMRSSLNGVPLMSLQGELLLNPTVDPLRNEALVQMWMEVKLKPLLKSVTKNFLSCLSTKNFSCSTYQTMVKELSHHYSEMSPVRQKWIYTFFMYPFLSGDRVSGCMNSSESSEEWLLKNFGAFRVLARMTDFSTLNMVFSGLEVLHLLSAAQKAELLITPGVQLLDNTTIEVLFHSIVTGSPGHPPTSPTWSNNWTSPGHPTSFPTFSPHPTYDAYRPSLQNSVVNGFMTALKPISSFVHDFLSLTKVRGVSEMKSTTLTQFLLNWTLAELADLYRPRNTALVPEMPEFDVTNMEDWYQHVVMPVLKRFLPHKDPMHQNITFAFQQLFFLDQDNETTVILDVCSLTLDGNPCGLTDVVENVAHVLRCAAQTDLKLTEETLMRLVIELTKRLNVLIRELSKMDLKEVADELQQIFTQAEPPSLTTEHLEDPDFILKWFEVKLMPLLPAVPPQLLSCLSTKNFSCPVYQTIVRALSTHMGKAKDNPVYSQIIFENFIFPFLLHHNTSDPQCVVGNNSRQWLEDNFAYFSKFAFITDFYKLYPQFSGVEVIPVLSPKQLAELILLSLPTPPKKEEVIDAVFQYLVGTMGLNYFTEVLEIMVQLAKEVHPTCNIFKHIFTRLYHAAPKVPPDTEPLIWTTIDDLMSIAPEDCLPDNLTCPVIQINGSNICQKTSSVDLEYHVNTYLQSSCNYTLEKYACAQLEKFTASQLASALMCDLPGNSSRSKVLWKMLLTKHSDILNPALDNLADMSMTAVAPSATDILDVIGEMRVSMLTDEQLMNSSVIQLWFSSRLRSFLPFASGRFLHCLSNRNISCQSYQQILHVFVQNFENITLQQQQLVLKNFILRFLLQQPSGCVFATNSSELWLKNNFGPFSMFLSIEQLLHINPNFDPLEVLQTLTPKQIAELLVLNLPQKDHVINRLFNHLFKPDQQKNLPEFLSHLIMLIPQANLSCSSYKTLFTRLDMALATVSGDIASAITQYKMDLSMYIPSGCIIYSGECNITMTNETDICVGVNSTEFQLNLDSNTMSGRFCDFTVEEYACASLTYLSAEDLAAVLKCNRSSDPSSSRPVWKLFLSKASPVLDQALDHLSNMTLNPSNPALSVILDSIREIRLDNLGHAHLNNPTIIQLWFHRLKPLLPAVSTHFLSCLTSRGLSCSTYQHIVQSLSGVQPHMTLTQQMSVYTHFIKAFLTRNDTADPSCSLHNNHSGQWLQLNLGAFSGLLSFHNIQMLYSNFSALEALPQLTVRQLAEVSATPGLLMSSEQATMVMNHVPSKQLPTFFDDFSPAIMGQNKLFPSEVRSAILQVVFDRGNLSDPSVSDSIVMIWLHNRLHPLLVNLSPQHVAPFFNILRTRSCEVEQMGVESLNQTSSTLHNDTQNKIHDHIIQSLKDPTPLHCYNSSHSFYTFVLNSFLGFQVPNLTSFLSLMPHNRTHLLVNSMPPSHLGEYLRLPDVVDSNNGLCWLLRNYTQIATFLGTEQVVRSLRQQVLLCLWADSLTITSRPEVDALFSGLENYMPYLTKELISPNFTHNASCIAFQKLISVLGEHNYTATDFGRQDVFISIKDYLTSETIPRCYNGSNPELNSTAWFAEYIGPFMPFLTIEDLQTFGSEEVIQVFTVDPLNIALLNHSVLPINLTNYYTQLVYQQDINFNPLLLPLLCRCVAPGPAFVQLTAEESRIVQFNLTNICTNLDPQVSAALAGNLGDNITSTDINALGSQVTSLSINQLKSLSPMLIMTYLSTFSTICDWRHSQARIIVQTMYSSGVMQMNATSLLRLNCLLKGFPSQLLLDINGSELITASKNSALLQNLLTAPTSIQERFVSQIISHNNNNEVILQNVPDELATSIPRSLLVGFSDNKTVIKGLNRKKWKRQQAMIFFSVIANENSTSELGGANNLSSPVLQGFTCIGVRSIQKMQIKSLVKACRRKGNNRVKLVETQLTCMYNHIKGDSDVINFELYPPDLLLYYDYSLVLQASCRSYFEQLGDADFSLFSQTLSYKRAALIQNAIVCLGITNTSLTKGNILVLGNMCCFLDAEYIQTSDPFILEKLKTCEDITDDQRTAVENLLMTGATPYGIVSQWISGTLEKLGMLPLHFTSDFYAHINKREMRNFVRYFKKVLKRNGVGREKRRKWIKEIRKARRRKSKRSVDARCEVGEITSVTVSDESFPFDYSDISQFEYCLMPTFVKEHLDSITDKVDEDDYLKIVLSKLNEAYSNSSSIPGNEVQQFGPMSRVATVEDIQAWSITELDTLELLMVSSDGPWNLTVAEAVVLKYLSVEGNKLGSLELNIIQGEILCSLGTDVLMNISYQSLREMDPPDVSSCSLEKKKLLFHIIRQESTNTRSAAAVSADEYQLTQPYLGGADSEYVQSLVQSNINMDMPTFTSLDQAVVLNLSVSNVKDLLGTNVAELKSYENNSLVQNWTSRQLQSELNTLGVGLMGGRADTTASSSSPNTAVTVTPGAATNATGVPSNPTNATGVTLNPTNATGVPSNPTNATGVTLNPTNATGVPSNPTNATGVTLNPTNATGVTLNPTNATGVPSNPTNATGVPSNPTNATGVTSNPTNATGVTSNPTNATGVTSNPTNATNPSNSSTAVPGSSSGGSTGGSNNVTTTTTTTAATTTKGHASRIRSDAGFSFLVMLTLLYFM